MLKLGVIGSGTMGIGIAQVGATAGWNVTLLDTQPEVLQKAENGLEKVMKRLVEKRKVTDDRANTILSKINFTTAINDFAGCDLVIEAIVENLEIKKKVFIEVEQIVSSETIIASNTSSLSLAAIGSSLQDATRFIGIHFFNPAPLMPLVEIIPSVQTKQQTIVQARRWVDEWGKVTVLAKDTPGFIVNRVARPYYGESLRIFEEGKADIATIDWALKTLGGFRMGPFELMDFIGNDINYTVTETVFKSFFYDPRYKPSFTQKRMAEAGLLGRKSGKGYYNYTGDSVEPKPTENETVGNEILNRVLVMLINEAADALYLNIGSKEDIDLAMTKGVNYPNGLLHWADEIGIDTVVNALDALYNEYHEDRYRCSPLLRKMNRNHSLFYTY